jgi:DNA-3-methyladenine glycosylase
MQPLPRTFYDRDTIVVARELLGKHLVHVTPSGTLSGRIVETEAYLGPHDLAAHSSKGLTARTKIMFGPPGFAYVYLIYGMHHCMNVVTEPPGNGAAVLLRALEPVTSLTSRSNGPGLLCRAMHIDRRLNGHDLLSADFFIMEPGNCPPGAGSQRDEASVPPTDHRIVKRPRIGVDYARHWAKRHLRFYIKGNQFVSRL